MIAITTTPQAHEWHRKPKQFKGACPVCGFTPRGRVEHRIVLPEENLAARWLSRTKTKTGWYYTSFNERGNIMREKRPQQKPETQGAISQVKRYSEQTRIILEKAAGLFVLGKTFKAIAEQLGKPCGTLLDFKRIHPELWKTCVESAMAEMVQRVRDNAGTDAVLADPDGHNTQAQRAMRWLGIRGEKLFPTNGETTLSTFFEGFYLPHCLFDARPATIETYHVTLNLWIKYTGDPTVTSITNETLTRFRDCLLKRHGIKGNNTARGATVRCKLRHLQAVLDKLGPAGQRNREAVGLLKEVPWCRPPREELPIPKIVSKENLQAVYKAADLMTVPKIPGIEPPAWWRALIAIAYNTGHRRRTLFSMRMTDIDWKKRIIIIPAERFKSRRPHVIPLNDDAYSHLVSIRTARDLVFPWPATRWHFDKNFHLLQYRAKIPTREWFGLHNLRKTIASLLWETSPQAATLALGHVSGVTTQNHYINPTAIVAQAMNGIESPWGAR